MGMLRIGSAIIITLLTGALLLLLLPACGGNDPATPDDNDDPGGDISGPLLFHETDAVIDRATASLRNHLVTLDLDASMQAVVAEMLADTCVATADWMVPDDRPPYLEAEFINGITFFMPVIPRTTGPPPSPHPSQNDRTPGKSLDLSLTGNAHAVIIAHPDVASETTAFIPALQRVGYSVHVVTDPQVDSFEGLDAYSLVYIGTHGLLWTKNSTSRFYMLTNQPRSSTQDSIYFAAGEFQDRSISLERVTFSAENEDLEVSEWTRYVVSNKYIAGHNGSFPAHTLFYVDACQSAKRTTPNGPAPLSVTLQAMGVQDYLGWSHFVYDAESIKATNYLFAHLLGDIPGSTNFLPPESPPIRPASLQNVFTSMEVLGYTIDGIGTYGAELELHDFSLGHGELLVRPAISQMIVDVDPTLGHQHLKLLGNFGPQSGSVSVCSSPEDLTGGTALGIVEWTDDQIIADLGNGTHGYVVVGTSGRLSNPHPLTQWAPDIDITGTFQSGRGPDFEVTMRTVWRGEIVDERPMPYMDPYAESGWTSTLFGLDALCDYKYTGIFEDSRYIYEYKPEMNTDTVPTNISGTEMYFGTITMKPSEGTAVIQATFSQEAKAMVTDKLDPEAPPVQQNLPVTIGLYIEGEMTADGIISEGSMVVPYMVSWPEVQPDSPPLDSTGH